MRKHLKRTISMLLAVVMVLAMLPSFALAARETFTVTPIEGIPTAGTAFVIYHSTGVVMGSESNAGKTAGANAYTNEETATIQVEQGAGVYKLEANSDGTYYLTCGGRYYTASSTSKADFTASAGKGSKWKIETLGDGYRIANTDFAYSGNPACLEVYNGAFSPYGYQAASESLYVMHFYSIDEAQADPDGDGYCGVKPSAGEKPANGSKIVIYNDYGGKCFGPQTDDALAPSLIGIDSYLDDSGKLNAGNGALIFDVIFDGTYYTFKNGNQYLRTSPNEGQENAECL